MSDFKMPTETVSLPSKGLLYPKDSPLSKGEIEMKYMTAKEEDILTNSNFIKNGTVIDKLLQSLIVTPITYDELLVGDKNAILIAARILGYGAEYQFKYTNSNGQEVEATVDLSTLNEKQIDESLFKSGTNEFTFDLPKSGNVITFKLLTHGDEKKIEDEIKGLKKINPNLSPDVTTRLKHIITSINGNRERKDEIDDIYLSTKGLARELKIPIWSVSQVNRAGAKDDIIEGDKAAGSYDKIMVTDVAISLSRKKEDKVKGTGRFHIMLKRLDYYKDGE